MYSKTVMERMVGELQLSTLVTLAQETLNGIGSEADTKAHEAVSSVEMVVAELRRRIPAPAKESPPARTRKPKEKGAEQNG